MKPKLIYSIVFLLFCCSAFGQPVYDYSKTIEYGNVRLSVKDVKEIVSIIESYHNQLVKSNRSGNDTAEFELELRNNSGDTIVSKTLGQALDIPLEKRYSELRLRYRINRPEAARINLWCSNYGRSLFVAGPQKNKLQVLFDQINTIIKKKRTEPSLISWDSRFRSFLFIPGMIIARLLRVLIDHVRKKRMTTLPLL